MEPSEVLEIVDAFDTLSVKDAHATIQRLSREGPEVLDQLLTRLDEDTDEARRISLMRVIGTLAFVNDYASPELTARFRAGLGASPTPRIRATWVKNLGKIGRSDVLEEILTYLEDDDARVRANAVEGIAFLVKRSKVSGSREVLDTLEAMLRCPNVRVRVCAALALFYIHRLEAEGLFCYLRRMVSEGDVSERRSATRAIKAFDLRKGGAVRESLDSFGEDSLFYLLTNYGLDFFD